MRKTKTSPRLYNLLFVAAAIFSSASVISTSHAQPLPQFPSYAERFRILARTLLAAQKSATPGEAGLRDSAAERAVQDLLALSPEVVRDTVLQSVLRMREAVLEAENTTTSEDLCVNHTAAIVSGLIAGQTWALQMLDAMGKVTPGVTSGNLNWPGAYHQCLDVRANTTVTSDPYFSGQYCTATAYVAFDVPSAQVEANGPPMLLLGLCVPDSCSELFLTGLVSQVISSLNVTALKPGPVFCPHRDYQLDTRAIVAITICSIFVLLLAVGTALDILYIQQPKWRMADKAACTSENDDTLVETENQPLLKKREDIAAVVVPEIGLCTKLLVSFSVYTNGSKLLSTSQPPGSLTCIHGIRILSMAWVVLGHSMTSPTILGENVMLYFLGAIKRWTFQVIANGTLSVDSFFVLSGLLVAYLSLKEMKKKNGKLNWFLFYFHRFWRLTPVYMMCIMIYVCLMRYWGEGPFWPSTLPDRDNCKNYWWTNLLYINDLVYMDDQCFGHAWYLANDMQFYILSPLIFVPFYFFPVAGVIVSGIFLLVTSVTPAILTVRDHFPPAIAVEVQGNDTNLADYMNYFYVKPYNRMGPYVVGMLAGYFLYRTDCKLKIGKLVNLSLWAVATGSALAVVYGLYHASNGHPVTLATSAFYNAVNRQVWGACVAWVVIACVTGNGGFVNSILSWSALVPLSRLTYCIYLLHPVILEVYTYSLQSPLYVNDINLVVIFLALFVISCLASFVVSLFFEAPAIMLEKVLLHMKAHPSRRRRNLSDVTGTISQSESPKSE